MKTLAQNTNNVTNEGFYFSRKGQFFTSENEALIEMIAIINSEPSFYMEINTNTATKEEIQEFLFNEDVYYFTTLEC